ncbi:unnamed protein product [Rhizoctonia solani]|uniref:Nephrocystin 3-like N-terminal domain-containing protein n=1 Tax=Rhizoctonia solani TaxID=456999 RepID=A0A8H3DUH4_9AGAM|nr:unnamed protein product [Rhizoctonia solani]
MLTLEPLHISSFLVDNKLGVVAEPPTSAIERFRHWVTDVEISPADADPNCKFSARFFVDHELVCNLPWIDDTRSLRWSGFLLCEVSPLSKVSLRLCRGVKDKPRYFNFPPFVVSEVDENTGEFTFELPEAAWVVTVKSLTPRIAEQRFSAELEKFNAIDIYGGLEPNETGKHLFIDVLQFAIFAAEVLPESTTKVLFLIYMKAWELLDQQVQLDEMVKTILHGFTPNIPLDEEALTNAYDVGLYLERLNALQKVFYASWSPCGSSSPATIYVMEEPMTPWHHAKAMFDEPIKTADWHEILDLLKPTNPSGYDLDRACLEGTRESVLNRVYTWTQNRENLENFMWISGQAGMGKTAIATSLCRRLDGVRALAASFFYRRDDPSSGDPLALINNLACEMAMNCPTYAHEVSTAIRMNPKLCNAHLSLRYQGLIKKPLKQLKFISMPTTMVVIVDGLDECGDEDARAAAVQRLYEISTLVPWLKVIVTSRPVGDLRQYFKANCPLGTVIHLPDYDAASDIRAYFQGQLGRLAKKEKWPADSITRLCTMSQGVFLWAKLAAGYIKKSAFTALPRLQKILKNQTSPVTDHFDALYTRILDMTVGDGEDEVRDAYLRCIGSILLTSQRKTSITPDLQYVLLVADQVDQPTLEQILRNLAPLLLVTEGRIGFLHSSFKDFISDSSRAGRFHIQLDECQVDPAASCLKLMQRELRFNICNLETSHILNSQVPDLKLRIQSNIGQTLRYASLHWIDHFISSPNQAKVEAITEFLEGPQLMYWVEVLSLLGRLDVAIGGLANLASLELVQFSGWSLIRPWVKDARRLLLSFYDAIATSTPHLYISALAFAPSKSPTAHRMRRYFPNTVTVAKDPGLAWHPCVKTIAHLHSVQCLSMSPDGLAIIVGYADGSLGIWDLQTGARISESLVGHGDSVTCVVYSPNGNLIASGSYDTTIRVWDVADGLQSSHVLTGHSGVVYSIDFSPDSSVLASGSSDNTIWLWGTKTMCAIQGPYMAHSNIVSSVVFSPDGTQLASGSWDKTIRVWSVASGGQELTEGPLLITGHSDSVTCLAFSPDGSKIASGSTDRTMQMWDSWTGKEVESCTLPAKHSNGVNSIVFSSNGALVISTSSDGRIHLRNATTLEETVYPFGHSNSVDGVAFSPDGTYIVSGSTDMTTRVWEITTLLKPMTPDPLVGHTSPVHCVAISSDGTRIISGSGDHTVRMWDAQTGAPIGKPYTGHSSFVYGLAFVRDGTRFVSCSIDMTLKLWDTTKQTLVKSHSHPAKIRCVASSPDGALVAFGSDDEQVHLWDPKAWKKINSEPLEGHSDLIWSLVFSPDGACLASGSSKAVCLWDTRSHSLLGKIASSHTQPIRSIALTPCGTGVVSGSDDNTARLWDVKTGNTVLELVGHSSNVAAVAFSPDGSCIASASFDNTIRLWNSKTGQNLGQPLVGHSKRVRCLAFSPDGTYLVSGSDDNSVRAWSLDAHFRQSNDAREAFSWPNNPCELSSHSQYPGWVTQDQESLVFWLPPYHQRPEQFPGTHPGVPCPRTFLDYSKLVHGTAWTDVASGPVAQKSG